MRRNVTGRSYGQRVPPLTSVIKSILERYPDGGQILKEIIQNADDAGATSISFLLDSRQHPYGTDSLCNPELAKFQGPALYSSNNAQFKDEDWDGLESLMDSNKKEEPLKVGRFGIGFNSIYHVTDLPSVASGDRLAFLDPHEMYFGKKETGQQYDLHEPLLDSLFDQFSPFEDVLGYHVSKKFVNGTIFRFPLRNQPSKLSQKLYTPDKVRNLFQSLKEEASLILLFLKNIEEIKLYETDDNQKERIVFSVCLDECCRAAVHTQKNRLLEQVAQWESNSQPVLKLTLEMVITIFDSSIPETRSERWLTHNQIGDKKTKTRQKALELCLLPWVGFAAPLTVEDGSRIGNSGGRIFCFLPLPPDADSRTGYPVHIHGYFGLTDNRRGLKWPGPECQNDDMAEWNKNLMKYVGADAYATLLVAMATRLEPGTSQAVINNFYRCWPDRQIVFKHWRDIIDIMSKRLLSEKVFWSKSKGGQWLSLDQAVFHQATQSLPQVVTKVLLKAEEPIVFLPPHVYAYLPQEIRTIRRSYVRSLLKKNHKASWNINSMSRNDKIAMLEYIMPDKNFAVLDGIALLPLANGQFTSFKVKKNCHHKDIVYVESQHNRMCLLPGMENRFLDPQIPHSVLTSLNKAIHQSALQLVSLEPRTVINLLRNALPKTFWCSDPVVWHPSQGGHPPIAWLEEIWKWLRQAFPCDLSDLEGFPIIECSTNQGKALVQLKSRPTIIRQQNDRNESLPCDVLNVLKKVGVTVLTQVPPYMMQHPCFTRYVADASPEGVLTVLENVGLQRSVSVISKSTPQEKRCLREILSNLQRTRLSRNSHLFIKSLPIYEAIDGSTFISAQNKTYTAPHGFKNQIPLQLSIRKASSILSIDYRSSRELLLSILEVPQLAMGAFLTKEVFPYLSSYPIQQTTTLMCWVLRRINVFRSEEQNFSNYLSKLKFVHTGGEDLSRPRDLFDPRSSLNQRLFECERGKFPVDEFSQEDILVQLRILGMKPTPDQNDVVTLVDSFESFIFDVKSRKATALLEFLDKHSFLLDMNVSHSETLSSYLQDKEWIPCKVTPSAEYPKCMPWKSVEPRLLQPDEVVTLEHSATVGAVKAVLPCKLSVKMQNAFKWNAVPDIPYVNEQLRIACTKVNVNFLIRKNKEQFCKMLKQIYQALAESYHLIHFDFPWIWNGHGFSFPNQIAFSRGTDFDLEPYLHTVPDDMEELHDFFRESNVKECFTQSNLLDALQEIKVKHDNEPYNSNVAKDRQLALNILQWIVRAGPLKQELWEKVYVPVMNDPAILKLVPLSQSTFCDADWLRGNFVELQRLPELCEMSLIDENISNATALRLGVPPMSTCVTAPEILGFEQAGPYEPITRRLKNILDEYKEGAGVFKELIQNADDAGATEVKFVVDWRSHPGEKVLAEGMKETQGPALLAYNNAMFTEDDFQNINKLAGATKKEDLEKIGRFGLGFNSVYHLTDTPSFLSSKYAVFFDPDTNHLGHFIRNPSHPGIKLNLQENSTTLRLYSDQFQPYHGVFNCDVREDAPFNYKGTLFRFPFRRCKSEICDKQYKKQDVDELLNSFYTNASTLLLNTQTVCHVSVWELEECNADPGNMKLLMKTEKTVTPQSTSTFLHDCAVWSKDTAEQAPQRIKKVYTTLETTQRKESPTRELWLQCDLMGTDESLRIASSPEGRDKGLLSCAGVAVNLKPTNKSKTTFEAIAVTGEAFCFLPLSIPTGLPVHVNGYLAITSNRRAIWEETSEGCRFQPIEVRWNQALMKDAISQAYLKVLHQVQQLDQRGEVRNYNFCSLWPNPDHLNSHAWKPLAIGVYSLIASSSLPLVKSGNKWFKVEDCIYPDADVNRVPGSIKILQKLGYKIANLPPFARKGFTLAEYGKVIQQKTITQTKFLQDVFFPNIERIEASLRDQVVCYVIDKCLTSDNKSRQNLFQDLLKSYSCIPCSCNQELKKPGDLVHPYGDAAALYSDQDNMMPVGKDFLEPKRLLILEKLGMTKHDLNWDRVMERAESIEDLPYCQGLKRVSNLVKYLNKHISSMDDADYTTKQKLISLQIFPVMPKPITWFCPWRGENCSQVFLPFCRLYDNRLLNMVGCFEFILDESPNTGCGTITPNLKELLQIECQIPQVENVVQQLETVKEKFQAFDDTTPLLNLTTNICNDIYNFLQNQINVDDEVAEQVRSSIQDLPLLLVEDRFVSSKKLAFDWDVHAEPYLYQVPRSLHRYRRFLEHVGVKENFNVQNIISALKEIQAGKEDQSLNTTEFKSAKQLICKLFETEAQNEFLDGETPLPDQDKILRPAKELVINDAPWVQVTKNLKYAHQDIPIDFAHRCGAKDVRSKSLEGISRTIGEPFGQKELLTDRLAGILKSYPCDFGILKELLQNADDAKATEIHFIYDPRQHEGTRVFSDSWLELQGPALCVFNDRPFSEKDIDGIQRLGIGNKGDSPEKTGQYGIGFNSVYHLTDCPSFITGGNTLCILDPHAQYAPGATVENPGRLIGPIDEDTFNNYQDVFPGYLGDIFDLKDATMFRFPLRNMKMASKSKISKNQVLPSIEYLLREFQREAKDTLLFLNYVKKISISKIEDDNLKRLYEVSVELGEEDQEKRLQLANHVKETKHLQTNEITQCGVFYPMTIKDPSFEEKWLVQQTMGVLTGREILEDVPDGTPYGLLPRAGVATKVSSKPLTEYANTDPPREYKAFCFLPLPVTTKLPVHVNGHFALDSGRRYLWHDEDKTAFKTRWNHFIKTKVLTDAYVNLLIGAREHIPSLHQQDGMIFFTRFTLATYGLSWYETLFPSQTDCDSQWRDVVDSVLTKIAQEDLNVLPQIQLKKTDEGSKHLCIWLSPSQCFFPDQSSRNNFFRSLSNIGFSLVSFSNQTYQNFITAKVPVKEMTPDSVLKFLSSHKPLLKQLPCPINESSIESVKNLLDLIKYCTKSPTFVNDLEGKPLLYTRDCFLRVFTQHNQVYLSKFSHLVQCSEHDGRFADTEIVRALNDIQKKLFEQGNPVVKPMMVTDLARFLPSNFKEQRRWCQTRAPVAWDPYGEDRTLRAWLMYLWLYIGTIYKNSPSERFLEPLSSWPVIPTKDGRLYPVSLSKTVLNLTESESWSINQKHIVDALKKLQCPQADIDLMELKGADVSDVVKFYLAYPNSVNDVVEVLRFLIKQEQDISGRIDANDATLLLQFLQEDSATLKSRKENITVLRKLPFYKTIKGRLISLDGALSVFKIPPGIPLEESNVWMEGSENIFLEPNPPLDLLHQMLGVDLKSHTSCYIEFIFPKFSQLEESTRIKHLLYIRDNLLHGDQIEVQRMESALKQLTFIPDACSGRLHRASNYYDPRNPVFKEMLTKDKFPQKPFKEEEWLIFLCRIGLRTTFSKDEFLRFTREVEKLAEQEVTKAVAKKSQVLTNYFLQEESLHDPGFLGVVSTIKFVVAHKADVKLTDLVDQYLFEERSSPPCISFRNSLSNTHECLVWASAALLPNWAWPNNVKMRSDLGVLEKPASDQVFVQIQKICNKFASKDRDLKESICKLLTKVMSGIYQCLQFQSLVETRFHFLPLLLVDQGRVFIRCNQAAFEMSSHEEQPPYLYKVPREFGQFEVLFKNLGAVEKPCPEQYARILQIIQQKSKDSKLHQEEMRHVQGAVRGLFRTLKILRKRDESAKTSTCSSALEDVQILYLPNEKEQLKPSTSLYHASIQLLTRVERSEFKYDLIYNLSKVLSGFDLSVEELLSLLPSHLKVISLSNLLTEALHPDCTQRKCQMDASNECSNSNRIRSLLSSKQLIDGVMRILRYQKHSQVDDDTKTKINRLESQFNVVCLDDLETVLMNEKGEEAQGSRTRKNYFVKCKTEETDIYIQHGAEHFFASLTHKLRVLLNDFIGNVVSSDYATHLEHIILLGLMGKQLEIQSALDERGIERYSTDSPSIESEPDFLGTEIPFEFHYLLVQFEDFLFRLDEIVGFEKEDGVGGEQGKYIYARIVRETSAPNPGGRTKKAKRDPNTGKRKPQNPLFRRYLIDIGDERPIEVDVLDLYKLKRPEELDDSNNTTDASDCQDIVPSTSTTEGHPPGATATASSHRAPLPRTWEKAVKEVDKALADIMKLPEEKRKKAVKRLYLKWHPDKNPGMEELATKVVQYMQNEFERLLKGGAKRAAGNHGGNGDFWTDFFAEMNRRARQERDSYDNYRRSSPGFTRNFSFGNSYGRSHRRDRSSWSSSGFDWSSHQGSERADYQPPNPTVARIWLIQCRGDLESVKYLFNAENEDGFYWLICFQCNQVVEKALKAALYGVSGISESQLASHDLTSLAVFIRGLRRAPDLVHSAGKLWQYYLSARYPNRHCPPRPPKDVYTLQQAREAYDIAKEVLKAVEEFIGILHV